MARALYLLNYILIVSIFGVIRACSTNIVVSEYIILPFHNSLNTVYKCISFRQNVTFFLDIPDPKG